MKEKTKRKRVGIWLRVSTEDQVLGDSPKHHEERARAYALAKDWEVMEVYQLDAVSGKTVREHPLAQKMLDDIKRGHIQGLMFSKLARLARNTVELLEFAQDFEKHGADLISLQESIDTSTPAGRLFFTMVAAMAQWEREEISDRVRASVPIRAKLGKNTGGVASFGYQWKDGKLMPDPEEAPVRALIYEMFKEHKHKKAVSRILNEKGHRTRNGSKFTDTTISRLLRDPTAMGVHIANYTQSRGTGRGWDLKDESDWVRISVEPIISKELWDDCQRLMDESALKYGKRKGRKATYLFSGLVYCGMCEHNAKIYPQKAWGKYRCFKCSNKIGMDVLEEAFLAQFSGYLLSEERVEKFLKEADQESAKKERLLSTLEKELDSVQKKLDKLVELYQEGGLAVQDFKDRYAPVEEQKRQIVDSIPKTRQEIDKLRTQSISKAQIMTDGKSLLDSWPKLTEPKKRQIVENLIEKIVVEKDTVKMTINYAPGDDDFVKRNTTSWVHGGD